MHRAHPRPNTGTFLTRPSLLIAIVLALAAAGCAVELGETAATDPAGYALGCAASEGCHEAVADTYVRRSAADRNYGTQDTLLVDDAPEAYRTFLRFQIPAGRVRRATLRLFTTNATPEGPQIFRARDDWDERTVTWNRQPTLVGSAIARTGRLSVGWVDVDVSSGVSSGGVVSFAMLPTHADGLDLSSREGENAPQLLVEYADTGDTCEVRRGCYEVVADSYVDRSQGDQNFGRAEALSIDEAPTTYRTFLRFEIPEGRVRRATLRVFTTDGTPQGPQVFVARDDWDEGRITWNRQPARVGGAIATTGRVDVGWLDVDVSSGVSAGGTISLALMPTHTDGHDISSREGANPPQLVVEYGESSGSATAPGRVSHVGTTVDYSSSGRIDIARPSGTREGDLLILALHRTDDDLPLYVSGWTRLAECYKRDNGYDCSTEAECTRWHNDEFCADFGPGAGGHDLAQSIFFRVVGASERSRYSADLNYDDSDAHPGWAILTALRGADTRNPLRDWSHEGCDGDPDSVFPSVRGEPGDMVLLSQSYDDAIAQSRFGAPSGMETFGYVSQSDEAGFLFGRVLTASGSTGRMETRGEGGSSCKDALVSLTIRAR